MASFLQDFSGRRSIVDSGDVDQSILFEQCADVLLSLASGVLEVRLDGGLLVLLFFGGGVLVDFGEGLFCSCEVGVLL